MSTKTNGAWLAHPNCRHTPIYHYFPQGSPKSLCNKVPRNGGAPLTAPPAGQDCARCALRKAGAK